MNRSLKTLAVVLVTALAATACGPTIAQRSVAPPGRTASLVEIKGFWGNIQHYTVELSQGVALALTCHDFGGPCKDLKVRAHDPVIATVRKASLANLETTYYSPSNPAALSSSGFVLLGRTPGKTRVEMKTDDDERILYVTIVAPPQFGNEATKAVAVLPVD